MISLSERCKRTTRAVEFLSKTRLVIQSSRQIKYTLESTKLRMSVIDCDVHRCPSPDFRRMLRGIVTPNGMETRKVKQLSTSRYEHGQVRSEAGVAEDNDPVGVEDLENGDDAALEPVALLPPFMSSSSVVSEPIIVGSNDIVPFGPFAPTVASELFPVKSLIAGVVTFGHCAPCFVGIGLQPGRAASGPYISSSTTLGVVHFPAASLLRYGTNGGQSDEQC